MTINSSFIPRLSVFGTLLAFAVPAEAVVFTLSSENDGVAGRARYGSFSGWESTGFISTAPTMWVGHWYDSWSANGQSSTGYLQIPLAAIAALPYVESVTLSLYIEGFDNGDAPAAIMYHVNSATANGSASQQLGSASGGSYDINPGAVGWRTFDITADILVDLNLGNSFSAYSIPSIGYRGFTVRTADYADADYRPTVTAIPEPALAAALAALAALITAPLLRRRLPEGR
jgi:hypothetical protein